MYKLWKETTIMAALQALTGSAVYYATGGAVLNAALLFLVLTFLLSLILKIGGFASNGVLAIGCAVALFATTVCFELNQETRFGFVFLLLIELFVLIFVMLEAKAAKKRGAKEPLHLLVGTAIPLGIGTVLGGTILLYRQWQRFRETVGWV